MSDVERTLGKEVEERLRFEALISRLSARFINLAADEVDAAIEEAQRLLCESMELDRSCLFQRVEAETEMLLLTHLHQTTPKPALEKRPEPALQGNCYWLGVEGAQSPAFKRIDARHSSPWIFEQMRRGEIVILSTLEDFPPEAGVDKEFLRSNGTQSTVVVPLAIGGRWLGCLSFAAIRQPRTWSDPLVKRFQFIADVFTNALARKRTEEALKKSLAEIQELRDRLQAETEYLRAEIKVRQSFGEIVGQSSAIKKVLHEVEQVALAECPVLITGETGTGKELVARAIHRLSARRDRAMVKVNCAALPSTLIESELFGREKGAFTGAMTSQAGRFEVADGSTIFLDEVAELSPEVQAKLLRVLQEGEFERLGSPRVRRVNARVIAATNRNLAEEVQHGRFRQDLYYRLSVFPIQVPPLRDRAEDIPALVSAFVAEFGARAGKRITKLNRRTMAMLQAYSWPGNIRELRNVLEHGVILSTDEVLRIPPLAEPSRSHSHLPTLAETERDHILKIFEKTHGRIKGPHGAAELLGMHPATLYSRMRKLGIISRRQKG